MFGIKKAAPIRPQVDGSLEDKLMWLTQFGRPRLSMTSDQSWHANVELFVNVTGAEFRVYAGYDHRTAHAALDTCIERVREAINHPNLHQLESKA